MTRYETAYSGRAKAREAFTLAEVMMALFIFSAVMAGVYTLFISCQKLWHSTSLDCYVSNEASMALERFVYGDGWTPGLRAAYRDSITLLASGSDWELQYSTPETTNNTFRYDSAARTLEFQPGSTGAPFHVALNVAEASVGTNMNGVSFAISVEKSEGMFEARNDLATYVAFRN